MVDKQKLYAIVDDGNGDGDSAYYAPGPEIEYREGMTLQEIRDAWLRDRVTDEGGNVNEMEAEDEYLKEEAANIKVAWIVTGKHFNAIGNSIPECWNDSAVYAANRSAKGMARALAVKIVTEAGTEEQE